MKAKPWFLLISFLNILFICCPAPTFTELEKANVKLIEPKWFLFQNQDIDGKINGEIEVRGIIQNTSSADAHKIWLVIMLYEDEDCSLILKEGKCEICECLEGRESKAFKNKYRLEILGPDFTGKPPINGVKLDLEWQ